MLSQFIDLMPGWILHDFYIDNGYSGGSFLRPAFQEMMRDVREGRLNLVLVKDLSRFGRNYLEAGRYLEEELPALGCRFVALGDGVDTANGENDIVPFINAMNEYHIKNHSDRVRSVMAAKARDGQKISGHAPYGYLRSPEDHTRRAVGEYEGGGRGGVVRRRAEGGGKGNSDGPVHSEGMLPRLLL